MTAPLRRRIKVGSLGFALAAFLFVNLDTRPRVIGWGRWAVYEDSTWPERFLESLLITPMAMVPGALLGTILGCGVAAVQAMVKHLFEKLSQNHRPGS